MSSLGRANETVGWGARTAIGLPVSLLWTPYAALATVILILMLASFAQFHRKNGHKYRKRDADTDVPKRRRLVDVVRQQWRQHIAVPSTPASTTASTPAPPAAKKRRQGRPLAFTSNTNGSMVDVRCGQTASLQTFHTAGGSLHGGLHGGLGGLHGGLHGGLCNHLFFTDASVSQQVQEDQLFLLAQTAI